MTAENQFSAVAFFETISTPVRYILLWQMINKKQKIGPMMLVRTQPMLSKMQQMLPRLRLMLHKTELMKPNVKLVQANSL